MVIFKNETKKKHSPKRGIEPRSSAGKSLTLRGGYTEPLYYFGYVILCDIIYYNLQNNLVHVDPTCEFVILISLSIKCAWHVMSPQGDKEHLTWKFTSHQPRGAPPAEISCGLRQEEVKRSRDQEI